jgi:hypothetical protein
MSSTNSGPATHYTPQRTCVITLCFLLAATSACARAGGKDYFPLTDGARWEYSGRFSSSNGGQYNVRATAHADGETLINGKRYFKLVTTADFSAVPTIGRQVEDVRYYRVADDGIYFRPGNDPKPDKPDLLEIPLPIPIGVKWLSGATEVQAESAGILQINGREYRDCLRVTFKLADGFHTTTNYYAPGVGIIKIVYVNTSEPKSIAELMLEKYER